MDNRFDTIEAQIKVMSERCDMVQNRILNEPTLTPDQIVELRDKQTGYQMALQWLINIKADVFPPKIIPANNLNGIKK